MRLSLQDLVLRVKVCKLGDIEETLSEALDPPLAKNIRRAIDALIDVDLIHLLCSRSWGTPADEVTGQSSHTHRRLDAFRATTCETPTRCVLGKAYTIRQHLSMSGSDPYSSCHFILKIAILRADGRKAAG